MKDKIKLTQQGQERLRKVLLKKQEQLAEMERFIRQQLLCKCDLDHVSLREARLKKQDLEQRIEELEETLEHAVPVMPPEAESLVDLGALVTLLHQETGERITARLVSAPEADVAEDTVMRISDNSPVGQQLRGRYAGDVIHVKAGDGRNVHYRVLDVLYHDIHVDPKSER